MLRYYQRPGDRSNFERPEGMSPALHRLLMQRGIHSAEAADAFLHPSTAQLNDPYLLSDMRAAAGAIREAIEGDRHICIFGDYDVDGVCASSILSLYLTSAGADAEVYLPSRHSEGYGLNEAAVREIAQRSALLVTVDCGIASHDLIDLALSLGLKCVVTDHHRPGDILPDCPTVNPLLNDYPFPYLCGAGVAFKLVDALAGREAAMEYIDLAAIATVADVVSLTGENRAIVYLGLQAINAAPRPGVEALMGTARIEPGALTAEGIAFRLAPRLNAGGRLGSARRSFELLTQTESFPAIAGADELEQENLRRQSIEREIRAAAEAQLKDFDFSAHRILIVHGEGWNPGVIGLTASHLKEEYHYPVIALSEADGMLTGSCRSIEGVDIYKTLNSAAPLLERFGGHAQAAGLTVRREKLAALRTALDEYLLREIPAETYLPRAEYDIAVQLGELDNGFVSELAALEPTGCGNSQPVFRCDAQIVEARAIGADGSHLRLVVSEDGVRRTGIYFGAGRMAASLGARADLLFTPQLNSFRGKTDVQLRLSALRDAGPEARIQAALPDEVENQRKFLTELLYNRGIQPDFPAEEISFDEIVRLLTVCPQGTLIITADLATAQRFCALNEAVRPDLALFRLPEDPRAFNTVSVCPERLEPLPAALRMLVLAGFPAPRNLPEGLRVLRLPDAAAFWSRLPDVDALREAYRAALHISRRPVHYKSMGELCGLIGAETGLDPAAALIALTVLGDLQLIRFAAAPFQMTLPPMHKTDPAASPLYRALKEFAEHAEGRN